jgi:hypothetical protein
VEQVRLEPATNGFGLAGSRGRRVSPDISQWHKSFGLRPFSSELRDSDEISIIIAEFSVAEMCLDNATNAVPTMSSVRQMASAASNWQ